jgi:hypothetical protein
MSSILPDANERDAGFVSTAGEHHAAATVGSPTFSVVA